MARRPMESLGSQIRQVLPWLGAAQAQDLAAVVERLIAALEPECIYVFGSQARGDAMADSDIDLLVVVPRSEMPPYRRSQEAYRALDQYLTPLDILVMTRDEFECRRSVRSSLPRAVLREGKVLYAA